MFIPVLLMGGIVGRVFREFAVTIAVAIVVSGFVSLTLTPMLCARVLKAHDADQEAEFRASHLRARCSKPGCAAYEWALDWVLARKALMLVVTLATLAGTVALYIVVPKGFFPQEDTGFLSGITEAATDTSFEAMTVRQKELTDILEPGSGGRIHQLHGRRGRPQPDRQFWPAVHRAEAEERAAVGDGGDGAAASEGARRFRGCRRSSRASRT